MTVCAACGAENPGKAKFCMECAASLTVPVAIAEERKTVTTLFCDLVAFTAMSEAADPEDVDAVLRRYYSAARKVIENHGGTVEKFIGDAVVGVFGVPAAHEDDPERAVRAALRIVEALEGMARPDGSRLEVRVGVNTGEALVRLDVTPGSGEGFLTGDAVNTAARLQAAAPPGGVAIGGLTHSLTEKAFLFEALAPLTLKGKREPVTAWLVKEPRSRTGLRTAGTTTTPFFGRRAELVALQGALTCAIEIGRAQFCLLVGEPGIGKSRLVLEFAHSLEVRPELITWRQGRCLPYGDGIAFWALGEILKAHAGILDSDGVSAVESKLDAMLPEGDDEAWLRQRLRPLLGLESSQAAREESFAAWARFLEIVASARPTVVVIEDLHWAGAALLAFIEHLLSQDLKVPLLIVATTRPELLQQHEGALTAADDHSLHRVRLPVLSQGEATALIAGLLDAELAPGVGARVLDLVGGNPLYAEQYVRLLLDRGLLIHTPDGLHLEASEELPLPDGVQAVLAARLDTLPSGQKALLCDAAVIGETFWGGGVAALSGRDEHEVNEVMTALVARDLVRPTAGASMAGEIEYLFWHAVAREAAYAQLPRRLRLAKHIAVADWLEARAGARAGDFAEILAHHYVTALEMARAAGETDLATSLSAPAIRSLTEAGDRVYTADLGGAERFYRLALDLARAGTAERATIQARLGETLLWSGRHAEAEDLLADAVSGLRAVGDARRAAVALVCLARARENVAGAASLEDLYRDAMGLLEEDGPSRELVRVLTECGRFEIERGELERGLVAFERAPEIARQIGDPEPALALNLRGATLGELGMPGCQADLGRSLVLAQQQGLGVELGRVWVNYCAYLDLQEGPLRALEELAHALAFARSRGLVSFVGGILALRVELLVYAGRWTEAIAEAGKLESSPHSGLDAIDLLGARELRLLAVTWRGEFETARGDLDSVLRFLETFHHGLSCVDVAVALLICAVVEAQSSSERALQRLEEMLATDTRGAQGYLAYLLPEASRIAVRGHDLALAERLRGSWRGCLPVEELVRESIASMLAAERGGHEAAAAGFADAAARWHDFGVPYEEGQALLGRGRCLVALGRAPEAAAPLAAARGIFARLGAKPALAETESVLAGAGLEV